MADNKVSQQRNNRGAKLMNALFKHVTQFDRFPLQMRCEPLSCLSAFLRGTDSFPYQQRVIRANHSLDCLILVSGSIFRFLFGLWCCGDVLDLFTVFPSLVWMIAILIAIQLTLTLTSLQLDSYTDFKISQGIIAIHIAIPGQCTALQKNNGIRPPDK